MKREGRQLRFRIDDRPALLVSRSVGSVQRAELTPSEAAVANLAILGYSNREIAERRHTSLNTVSNQLNSVYRKIGINSRSELAASFPFE